MSTSWRIKTILSDRTETAGTESAIIGATVFEAPKGPSDFYFFSKGDTQKVLDTFGYPSSEYPAIQDVLDVITSSSMYLASPSKNGKYGGVVVTPSGTIPLTVGTSTKTLADRTKLDNRVSIGKGNGAQTTFTFTMPEKMRGKYVSESFKIYKDGEDLGIEVSGDDEETITGNDISSSSYTKSTGEFTVTFATAPTLGTVIEVGYQLNVSDAYFTLFNMYPQKDDLEVKVTKTEETPNGFYISVARYDPIEETYNELINSPYLVSLSENGKDGNGQNCYIKNVFTDNKLLFTTEIYQNEVTTFEDDTDFVELKGGDRGEQVESSDLSAIYTKLQDTNKYQIKYVFDSTGDKTIQTTFETLRNDYQKTCRFLVCTPDVEMETLISNPTDYCSITNNRGIYVYTTTWGTHQNIYSDLDFNCSNMGLIAKKWADMLTVGGGTPAWIDENGVGGLLGSSITKLNKSVTESQMEQLDKLGFNPVVFDNNYGPMIEGWRSRQVARTTVFSYAGQSSLADTIIELIQKNVLPQRIGKLIDDTAYSAVRTGCNQILETYQQWLEDWYVLCDDTNNTGDTKNAQKLMVSVYLVFKGYAKQVVFNFIALKNGVSVQEQLK